MSLLESIDRVTESATGIVRLIAMMVTACVAIFSLFSYFAARNAVSELGMRAERVGTEAIEAARIEAQNARLAKEGWGYETADAATEGGFDDERRSHDGDWGEAR